jgi:hypothetical protein
MLNSNQVACRLSKQEGNLYLINFLYLTKMELNYMKAIKFLPVLSFIALTAYSQFAEAGGHRCNSLFGSCDNDSVVVTADRINPQVKIVTTSTDVANIGNTSAENNNVIFVINSSHILSDDRNSALLANALIKSNENSNRSLLTTTLTDTNTIKNLLKASSSSATPVVVTKEIFSAVIGTQDVQNEIINSPSLLRVSTNSLANLHITPQQVEQIKLLLPHVFFITSDTRQFSVASTKNGFSVSSDGNTSYYDNENYGNDPRITLAAIMKNQESTAQAKQ